MSELNRKELEEANAALEARVNKGRDDWNKKIIPLIEMIRDINKVAEAQVLMLSYRHQLADKIAELKLAVYRLNTKFDYHFKDQYRFYKNGYDLKLNGGETSQFVNSDLSLLKRQINIIQSHIDYYSEVIKTLDNLGFAIKRRIEIINEF